MSGPGALCGRCLLPSAPSLKGASVEEARWQDLRLGETEVDLAKGYVDLTDEPLPPALHEDEAPFAVQDQGETECEWEHTCTQCKSLLLPLMQGPASKRAVTNLNSGSISQRDS